MDIKPLRITISILPTNTADSDWNGVGFTYRAPLDTDLDVLIAIERLIQMANNIPWEKPNG